MPDKWPLANGNWSNAANWNGGTLPAIGDDVYADGRTVTLDVSIDIGTGTLRTSQRSGGTAGGSFITTPGITITANVAAGTAVGISHSSGFVTINGNISRGTTNNADGVYSNSSGGMQINGNTIGSSSNGSNADVRCVNGTTTITGNVTSAGTNGQSIFLTGGNCVINGTLNSTGSSYGVWMISGALTVNGNVISNTGLGTITNYSSGGPIVINGNLSGSICLSCNQFASAPITINGNITGNSGNCVFIGNVQTPSLTVTGNVAGSSLNDGGVGINIGNSTSSVVINGTVTGGSRSNAYGLAMTGGLPTVVINGDVVGGAGSSAFGLYNNTLGTARVLGTAIGNNHGLGGAGNGTPAVFGYGISSGTAQATTSVRRLQYGPKGQSPTAGLVQLDVTDLSLCSVKMRGIPPTFTEYTLATAENLGSLPSDSDVRLGTVFNFGTRTGTCAVPSANSVAFGVPVDNTTGTAVITEAGLLTLLQQSLAPNSPIAVERSIDDEKSITFSWPVSGATITGEKSVDNGAYSAVAGGISFLRTESGRHYYTLAYNAADRVNEEATIRYKMTDGTYTRYFNLRLVPPGITPQQIDNQLANDFTAVLTAIDNVPTANENADAVWDELMSGHTVNGSYGSHIVRSANQNQNTVAITGSQHIAADVHTFQANVIDATALASSAVTEIQSGLATTTQLTSAFTEIKGTGWDSATDTLEKIRDASGSIIVTPLSSTVEQRVNGTTITVFLGENITVGPIVVTDANGDPVNLSDPCEIVISKKYRGDILIIPNGSITRSGAGNNQFSFPSTGATLIPGTHSWALRRISDNYVFSHGDWIVRQVATKDT